MPAIIVQSNGTTKQDTNVLLYEDVQPEHLASEHHAAQLIERVAWAVTEAKDAEESRSSTNKSNQRSRGPFVPSMRPGPGTLSPSGPAGGER